MRIFEQKRRWSDQGRNPTTSFLTATTLIYAIGAGITPAAGTRMSLSGRSTKPSPSSLSVSESPAAVVGHPALVFLLHLSVPGDLLSSLSPPPRSPSPSSPSSFPSLHLRIKSGKKVIRQNDLYALDLYKHAAKAHCSPVETLCPDGVLVS